MSIRKIKVIGENWKEECVLTNKKLLRISTDDEADVLYHEPEEICIFWRKYETIEYLVPSFGENVFLLADSFRRITRMGKDFWFFLSENGKTFTGDAQILDLTSYVIKEYFYSKQKSVENIFIFLDPIERFIMLCSRIFSATSFVRSCRYVGRAVDEFKDKQEFIEAMICLVKLNSRGYKINDFCLQCELVPQEWCNVKIVDLPSLKKTEEKTYKRVWTETSNQITKGDLSDAQIKMLCEIYEKDFIFYENSRKNSEI